MQNFYSAMILSTLYYDEVQSLSFFFFFQNFILFFFLSLMHGRDSIVVALAEKDDAFQV